MPYQMAIIHCHLGTAFCSERHQHLFLVSDQLHIFLQFKRHKTKKHTRNFAKSVVNLVDTVSCF